MHDDVTPEVVRNDEKSRYEILLGDTVAGYTAFHPDAHGRLVFNHTVVDPAFEGRGLGKQLVAAAMNDVAARGETVVPVCPFVVRFLNTTEVPGLTIVWRDEDDALEAAGNHGE